MAELASQAVVAKTAKSGGKVPLLRVRRVDRDVWDVEGRLGFVAFELDRVVGVSDDDVIDLLEQRWRSGPPVIADFPESLEGLWNQPDPARSRISRDRWRRSRETT